MAQTFQPTFSRRFFNTLITTMLRLGVKMGEMTLLTVRGRKTGQLRSTPVVVTDRSGQRILSSPYGNVQWVRNLRAAGEATLSRGRHAEAVTATELSNEEAAPLIKAMLPEMPKFLLKFYNVSPDAPLEDFVQEARRHPVFLIQSKQG